jgi:hypothetical protein
MKRHYLREDTSKILNVRAREYKGKEDNKEDNKEYIGYIAEELNEISKWFTWKNVNGSPEGIEWFNMIVYLIEECKKMRNEINMLKNINNI